MESICVWGDSIAYGSSDTEHGGWVALLRKYLEQNSTSDDLNVYNLGIPGDTTEGLVKRFESEAEVRNPDFCIFAIGINDSSSGDDFNTTRISREKFEQNLRLLIQNAKKISSTTVFVGLTRVDESLTQPFVDSERGTSYSNKSIQQFDFGIEVMCGEYKIPFIKMLGVLDAKHDLDDGLHPSAGGHQKMYNAIRDFLISQNIIEVKK